MSAAGSRGTAPFWQVMRDIEDMPAAMRSLAPVQFFLLVGSVFDVDLHDVGGGTGAFRVQ